MYKMKLQEVCHQKKWGLPVYSCIKDGPDHNPQFRASVSVNGFSFDAPNVSNSSKAALNEAAKLAVLHFTSAADANPIAEGRAEIEETHESSQLHKNAPDVKVGVQYQYKMQLQSYACSKNLDLPLYSYKKEGPPHALQFQATVTIEGHSFDSPGYFRTLKEAEHAAAKVALMSLDAFQEIDIHLYKNLLRELAQNEGFTTPEYKTLKCGPPHKPTFFSTVEVEDEIFHGKGGNSKNLAELSAAKVAYTIFMERKSGKSTRGGSWGSSSEEMLPSSDQLVTTVDPQLAPKAICAAGSSPDKENGVVSDEDLPVNDKASVQDPVVTAALPNTEATTETAWNSSCYSFESPPSSPKSDRSSSTTSTLPDLCSLSITTSNTRRPVEANSYLLCSRFRVYTCIPDFALPQGTVLLPIDDCKWVVASLEFSNENF